MRKFEMCIVMVVLAILSFVASGCAPVYGKGELPAEYLRHFGNSNGARLDYLQNNTIGNQARAIAELTERVKKLEDPND